MNNHDNTSLNNSQTLFYYPYVREGIISNVEEKDVLGPIDADQFNNLSKLRPFVQVQAHFAAKSVASQSDVSQRSDVPLDESKNIFIVGAGDISAINNSAILRTVPVADTTGFPANNYPYIEFWEPDFAWRYTPACPNNNRLRPWLALVLCESGMFDVRKKSGSTTSIVTFNLTPDTYQTVFANPSEIWKSAHAQGSNEKAEFCRVLNMRRTPFLQKNKAYTAMVIPVFEVGRLRGLGVDESELVKHAAQEPAWEATFDDQQKLHQMPYSFPVYYMWEFTTGDYNFDELVKRLTPYKIAQSGIAIDVTQMGEGLDYSVVKPQYCRQSIMMPSAMTAIDYQKEQAYPDPSGTGANKDEKKLYDNLSSLLSLNPVFTESRAAISGSQVDALQDDDPWVVPPIYGAKHVMATSLGDNKNGQEGWLNEINLDIHNRAAAGLGRKIVVKHQEEFVNRAWNQVEAVKSLNSMLLNKMMALRTDQAIKNNKYPWLSDASSTKFVSGLMQNLTAMRNTKAASGVSISSILSDMRIPESFATATFQRLTERLSTYVASLNLTSVMDSISKGQIFRMKPLPSVGSQPTVAQLNTMADQLFAHVFSLLANEFLGNYFSMENANSGVTDFLFKPFNITDHWGLGSMPSRHMSYYSEFVKDTPEDFNLCKRMKEFVDNHYHITYCPGYYTQSVKDICCYPTVAPDIVCMPSQPYQSIFGKNKPITVLSKGSTAMMFINWQALYDLAQTDGRIRSAIRFFTQNKTTHTYTPSVSCNPYQVANEMLNDDGSSALLMNHTEVNQEIGTSDRTNNPFRDITHYSSLYASYRPEYYKSHYGRNSEVTDIQIYKTAPVGQQEMYKQIQEEIVSFLINTPDYVMYDNTAECLNEYKQTFQTPSDLLQFCRDTNNESDFASSTLMGGWISLRKAIDKIMAQNKAEKEQIHQSEPVSDIDYSLRDIQNELLDKESYDRIRQVALDYYKEFFSNQELIDKYIDDLLNSRYPIMAYPQFPEPTYYYLKGISDKFILPGIDDIPANSVSVLKNNAAFVESLLAGMNTEMGRELLWREFPTDQRGSYFRKFWDSDSSVDEIRSNRFFDIESMHTWQNPLGLNHLAGKSDLLFFAIKGNLMKIYPNTAIYLQEVVRTDAAGLKLGSQMLLPSAKLFMRDDLCLVGFDISAADAIGSPSSNKYGYMLMFSQEVENLDFAYEADKETLCANAQTSAEYASLRIDRPSITGKHVLSLILN